MERAKDFKVINNVLDCMNTAANYSTTDEQLQFVLCTER